MKITAVATFLFVALASAELRKVPRSMKGTALDQHIRRQDAQPKTQAAAMATADGGIVAFDTAGVHKQMTADGL
ncbi:hypothetical protein SLS62_000505 [Diatrype stigma]|uniref:Uncharacterized protein n=1 Tax=Diatrype stigma TaxID=117547 RepID=A0AAN9YXJ7_9PEZI